MNLATRPCRVEGWRELSAEKHAIANESLFAGGQRFLYGGEVHYFRLDPDCWSRALARLGEAHMDTVSVYVPWNWHETEPGMFDFFGRTHPRRNLVRFLDLCIEADLRIHFRPGPSIQGEWRHGGLPDWLLRGHPEVLALDATGRPPSLDVMVPSVTYVHPVLLDHSARWFRAIVPLLRERADAIAAIQLDDELHYGGGVRSGDPLLVDYNEVMVGTDRSAGFYQAWLARRYEEVDRLNEAYGTRFSAFEEVQPPRRRPTSFQDLPWFHDWHHAKEASANTYVEHLRDVLVGEGIDYPLTMVEPYMTPYGCKRFSDFFEERRKPILVTTQSYPTLWSSGAFPEWAAGHVAAVVQTARGWNPHGRPLVSSETQASQGYHLTAQAMESFYALMIAEGLSGMSFYMLVGGDNPSPWGMNTGRSYDLGAAIGHDGTVRPPFLPIKRLGQLLDTQGKALLETEPILDLAVGYYPPYETTAQQGDTLKLGARHRYDEVLGQVFGLAPTCVAHPAGVLSLLTAAGYTYGMVDLERAPLSELLAHRQLWCLGLDFMSREVQAKLVAYAEGGGSLVLLPQVPHLGSDMQAEDLLLRRIGAPVVSPSGSVQAGPHRVEWHLIKIGDVSGMPVSDTIDVFDLKDVPGAVPIAFDERTGAVCGYAVPVGKGTATVLGFKPRFGWDSHASHRAFIRMITGRADLVPAARADGTELLVVERTGSDTAFLFVINPTTWAQRGRVTYRDPETKRSVTIPRIINELEMPDQGALILRVQAQIPGSAARLVYSTSQIQSWTSDAGSFEIVLYGPSGTLGEAALRLGPKVEITVDEEAPLQIVADGEETVIVYRHGPEPLRLRVRG